MKVKIFFHGCIRVLEEEINGWLSNTPLMKIHHITQSQDAGTEGEIGIIAICVWYEAESSGW